MYCGKTIVLRRLFMMDCSETLVRALSRGTVWEDEPSSFVTFEWRIAVGILKYNFLIFYIFYKQTDVQVE